MRVSRTLPLLLLLALSRAPAQTAPTPKQQLAAHTRLAQQYLAEHKPDLAIPELQAVVALNPDDVDARGNLGVLLFFRGDYAGAAPQLRAANQRSPGLWKLQGLLGIAERRLGQEASGRTDLEAAFPHIEDQKFKIEVGRDLIEGDAAIGDLDHASEVIALLLKLQPTDPSLLYTAYRIHSDQAGEALLGLSVAAPASGQMYQAMAHELERQGDLSAAIANFRHALAADPNLPGIHFELAEALHTSSDPKLRDESEPEYKSALAINPQDERSTVKLGDIAADRGDTAGAASLYQHALEQQPMDPDAALGMARIDMERGEPASAAPLLEAILAADPTNALAHYRLSATYRALKRTEDAKRELDAYQKYKAMKEKLRTIYKDMRLNTPGNEGQAELPGTPQAGPKP